MEKIKPCHDPVYCSNKFTYLKIDVEKRMLYNCHKAYPHRINSDWLESNPGQLFNTDTMLAERREMLEGKRNASCGYFCYPAEDAGQPSERQRVMQGRHTRDYTNPHSEVRELDVVLHSDCNLTCLYCDGTFSSAWRREIRSHDYDYPRKNWNDVYDRVSQKDLAQSRFFGLFLKEIPHMQNLRTVTITGGEPFLYNHLDQFLDSFSPAQMDNIQLVIYSGLGVAPDRFGRILDKIKKYKRIVIAVSAEGLGAHYELVRHGNSHKALEHRLDMIKQSGVDFYFTSTISNLSIFGFREFYEKHKDGGAMKIGYNGCTHPGFLKKNVMDNESKEIIKQQWHGCNDPIASMVMQGLDARYYPQQKLSLRTYLSQLSQHRGVSFDVLPRSFLNWLSL